MNRAVRAVRVMVFVSLLFIGLVVAPCRADAIYIKRQQLPNGLLVLHVERHSLPVVAVTLLVKASPLNEPPDKAGLASMTARMLTEGTRTRTAAQISEEIEFVGGSLSAGAGRDFTTLSLTVLKKDVEKGFDLLSDVLLIPSFPETELQKKKELQKGLLRQKEEDPAFVADKAFIKEVYGDNPYGRLAEGNAVTIDKIQRDDLIVFHGTYYRPDETVIAVVGDLTPDELQTLLAKYLSTWVADGRGAAAKQPIIPEPPPLSWRTTIISRDITQANIILGNLGIARGDPDYYAVSVMNYVLGGGGFASRLMKVVRDEQGLTYGIHSAFAPYKLSGDFRVEVQTKNESARLVIEETLHQMERIRTELVSEQELADAKAFLTGSFPRRFETSRKIADFLTASSFYNLGDDYIEKYPSYINEVTREDVLRVARKYLHPNRRALIVVGEEKLMGLSDSKAVQQVP